MNRPLAAHPLTVLALLAALVLPVFPSEAQLRRPGFVPIKREDRTQSRLQREEGAIYLEGMVEQAVRVRITQAVSAYSTLKADRWIGNLLPDQEAVLLAVSDRAYRVRAQASQGQVAGWISKSVVAGLPEDFEENLRSFHERYEMVRELIENGQIALGMTVEEVVASIGPPDKRSSRLTGEGRTDALEYISYQRVPQSSIAYDVLGRPYSTTVYVEMESGRVRVDFVDGIATGIEESEGIDFSGQTARFPVPRPVFLF